MGKLVEICNSNAQHEPMTTFGKIYFRINGFYVCEECLAKVADKASKTIIKSLYEVMTRYKQYQESRKTEQGIVQPLQFISDMGGVPRAFSSNVSYPLDLVFDENLQIDYAFNNLQSKNMGECSINIPNGGTFTLPLSDKLYNGFTVKSPYDKEEEPSKPVATSETVDPETPEESTEPTESTPGSGEEPTNPENHDTSTIENPKDTNPEDPIDPDMNVDPNAIGNAIVTHDALYDELFNIIFMLFKDGGTQLSDKTVQEAMNAAATPTYSSNSCECETPYHCTCMSTSATK